MITHIEIDGFKSFLDFKLDVPPFLALVGANSAGKSNLLDAIELLRGLYLGDEEGLLKPTRGRPQEQFHMVARGQPVDRMVLSAETLANTNYGVLPLRYFSVVRRQDHEIVEQTGSSWLISTPASSLSAAANAVAESGRAAYQAARDKEAVEAELVRMSRAHREEPRSWRPFGPEPIRMRSLAPAADTRALTRSGDNLAAVLGRMSTTEAFADLVVDFVALLPTVKGLVPQLDERREEWSFDVVFDGEGAIPSSLLSDGTLRVLGLLAALHDPDHSGVLLIEELENGLHPSRLVELLRRIGQRVTDADDPASLRKPLRQVILTTHSPVVVSELYSGRPDALVFLSSVSRVDPDNDRVSRVTVPKPVRTEGEPGTYVSPRQVRKYLGAVGDVRP